MSIKGGEGKGNFISRCSTNFWLWDYQRAQAPHLCCPVVLSSVVFCSTCVGKLCPEKGQIVNILGKSSTLPLSTKAAMNFVCASEHYSFNKTSLMLPPRPPTPGISQTARHKSSVLVLPKSVWGMIDFCSPENRRSGRRQDSRAPKVKSRDCLLSSALSP